MTSKEITKTVTVEQERSEQVTVCDDCGVEVEPGENCRTVLPVDNIDEFELSRRAIDQNRAFSHTVHINPDMVAQKSDSTRHYCFDCWDEHNLTLDENSISMAQSYTDKVMDRAVDKYFDEVGVNWKTIRSFDIGDWIIVAFSLFWVFYGFVSGDIFAFFLAATTLFLGTLIVFAGLYQRVT